MSAALKVPVTFSIDPDQLARLDQAAAELDRSRSWLLGRAVERILSPRGAPPSVAAEQPAAGETSHLDRVRPASAAADRGQLAGSQVGGSVFSNTEVASMNDTPQGALAHTAALHAATLDRALAMQAQRDAEAAAARERTAAQTRNYLNNLGRVTT